MVYKVLKKIRKIRSEFWLKRMIKEVEKSVRKNQKSLSFTLGTFGEKRF